MCGSGISWAVCKSAPHSRQITIPAPYHSVFTGLMPFLPPNQQRQSTEGTTSFTVTHTHTQPFNCLSSGTTWVGRYQKKHSPTHTRPDHRTSFITFLIYNDPWHCLCSVYVLDSPLGQPLSRSSLVFLLALDPQLHTPCISSPNHRHLFAAHAHTNAACFAAIPMLCHLYLVSLSAPYLVIFLPSFTVSYL